MDCGMPWGEWNERIVMLHPLRWWVSANSPQGQKELLPGTYRLVLLGANGELVRTTPLRIRGRSVTQCSFRSGHERGTVGSSSEWERV